MNMETGSTTPVTLAERMGERVNRMILEYLRSQSERPITDPISFNELRALFEEPLPRSGMSHEQVLDLVAERIMAHTLLSTGPGYLGLMNPTPMVTAIYADALASTMNQNQAASHHSPAGSAVEETVIRWLGDATGYGADCHGHLTSGGTVANLTGLKLALHQAAPEVRDAGLLLSGRKLAAYTSDQAHFSVERAMDLLGLGRTALRKIPARLDATIDLEALTQTIEQDRQEGWTPMAIVGMAGTTAAGAIDPLVDLADIAGDAGAWFHVDAAYGGAVGLSRRYPGLMAGLERADSVTVDAHKWFFVPFVAGGILHKKPDHELAAFRMDAAYIPPAEEPGRPPTDYYQRGVAGTRRFNALKVWMALKHMGADWYADVVDRQMDLARAVQKAVEDLPEWEVVVPASTAIITFRFVPSEIADAIDRGGQEAELARQQRDDLQDWIARTIQQEGRYWISSAPLPDGKGLRLNVISYLTDQDTIDGILGSLPELKDRARAAVL